MENPIINFDEFYHSDALEMGLNAIRLVKERQLRRIGVRVLLDNKLVFQNLMDGKNEDNYLRGKEKVVMTTNKSSMFVYENQDQFKDLLEDPSYSVSGGAIPIVIKGEVRGVISISGMTQELDHLIANEVLTLQYHQKNR